MTDQTPATRLEERINRILADSNVPAHQRERITLLLLGAVSLYNDESDQASAEQWKETSTPLELLQETVVALNFIKAQPYVHQGERYSTYQLVSRIEQAIKPPE